MRYSTTIAAVAAVAPIISAHDGPRIPKIAGLNMRDLKARNLMDNIKARAAELAWDAHVPDKQRLKPRQGGTDGKCGAGFGSCEAGYCCSETGCKLRLDVHQCHGMNSLILQVLTRFRVR